MKRNDSDIRVLARQWDQWRRLDPSLLARCENRVRAIEDLSVRAARLSAVLALAVLADLANGSARQAAERSQELRELAELLPPGDARAQAKLRAWQVWRWLGVGAPHEEALTLQDLRTSPALLVQYRLALAAQLELEDPHEAIRETASVAIAAADIEAPLCIQTEAITDLLRRCRRWGGLRLDEVESELSLRGPIPLDAREELALDTAYNRDRRRVPLVLYGRAHRALNDLTDALADGSSRSLERGFRQLADLAAHVLATWSAREVGRLLDIGHEGRVLQLADVHRARRALLRAGPFRFVGLVGTKASQETH